MYAINGENNYDKINIGGFTFSPVTGQLAGTWGPTSGVRLTLVGKVSFCISWNIMAICNKFLICYFRV